MPVPERPRILSGGLQVSIFSLCAVTVSFRNLLAVTSSMYLLPCFRLKGLKLSRGDESPEKDSSICAENS